MSSTTKKFFVWLLLSLTTVLVASCVVFAAGYRRQADLVSMAGTILVIIISISYIVFFDSKRRWPNVSAFQRYARVITFYRGS